VRPLRAAAAAALVIVAAACTNAGGGSEATTTAATTTAAPTTVPTSTSAAAPSSVGAPSTAPATATTLPAPAGDAFYTPPSPLPPGPPGDVIWARPFPVSGGAQGWLVLYRSTTVTGDPVAVSGVVIAPGPAAPAVPPGGRTVLAWAHGTTGLGDTCAPSATYPDGKATELAIAQYAVSQGWVYTATDYQGLGTPGGHPYAVGLAEGRDVLDSVRAAERLTGSGAAPTSKALVWGHSQGGGAAAFAGELQPTYAADVDLVGAIVGAPATEFDTIQANLDGGPNFGLALMPVVGFPAAYPSLSYGAILNAAGQQAVHQIADQCLGQITTEFAGRHASDYLVADPSQAPGWKDAIAANEAGQRTTPVPMFLYQGEADQIIPVAVSQTLLGKYCALGDVVERKTYPGKDHTSVIPAALPDILNYAADRLAGKAAPSSC
jgi:hypothetical protein